jgi:hypothetical protein
MLAGDGIWIDEQIILIAEHMQAQNSHCAIWTLETKDN